MSGIDIILLVLMLAGAYRGYKAGFLLSLFLLLGIVLGVLAGFKMTGDGMTWLALHYNTDQHVLPYVAFIITFLVVVLLVVLLGRAIKDSLADSFLGQVDGAAGAALGLIRTAFMLSVMLWILSSLHIQFPEKWTQDSSIYPLVGELAPDFAHWLADYFPLFKTIF